MTAVLDTFLALPRLRAHLLTLPRLPRTGLQHLLDHEDPEVRALAAADTGLDRPPVHAESAAANPGLPAGLLHGLFDLGGLPRAAPGGGGASPMTKV